MEPQAATPTGGAEASARPAEAQQPSISDRLKASLYPPQEQPKPETTDVAPKLQVKPAEEKQEPKAEKPEAVEGEEPTEDAEQEEQERTFSSFSELAEALGWDVDKLYDLEASTKVDGKEGKARLRDLVKSHQLEGHLNQKLMTFAEEKKGFETERLNFAQQMQHRTAQLDAASQVATRLLQGEYANVNWEELRASDPVEFASKAADFNNRRKALDYLADQIGQQRKADEDKAAREHEAYKSEQLRLMESKIPEWADAEKRAKDIADITAVASEAYGISEQELKSVVDHREIIILRDAVKWQKLQKAKPAFTQKVKAAPKLLKPGTHQSQASKDNFIAQKERERLRETGKVRHAKAPLKRLLFPNRVN